MGKVNGYMYCKHIKTAFALSAGIPGSDLDLYQYSVDSEISHKIQLPGRHQMGPPVCDWTHFGLCRVDVCVHV